MICDGTPHWWRGEAAATVHLDLGRYLALGDAVTDIIGWLLGNLKADDWSWKVMGNVAVVYFATEDEAVFFKLRFSEYLL